MSSSRGRRVAAASMSGASTTPSRRILLNGRAPLLSTFTQSPPSIPNMRKTLRTGLSTPFVASSETSEIRLILKLKSPSNNPQEIDTVFARQLIGSRGSFGYRDSIQRSVAVAVLRPLAGGTSLRVAFSQNNGSTPPLRKRHNDL